MRGTKAMHLGKRRKFKTIIVDRHTVMTALPFVLTAILPICIAVMAAGYIGTYIMQTDTEGDLARAAIENIVPSCQNGAEEKIGHKILCFMLGFDPYKPETIVYSQVSALKTAAVNADNMKTVQKENENQENTENQADGGDNSERYPIVETSSVVGGISSSGGNKNIYLNNETSFDINIDELLGEKLSIEKKEGPLVLIVHTHTTESYTPSGQSSYSPSESTRTQDKNYNVVRVGSEIAAEIEKSGIGVIHDETINDYPSYNGSYKKTLGVIEGYLNKYPSIQVVFDVHRDGMTKSDGTKLKVCAEVGGEKTSQVMVLCGSSEGGLPHPNWRENLKLGLRIQDVLTRDYKGLARPLHLVKERYNQHATKGSMIIEVGTDGNTIEEAVAAGKYTGRAIAKVLSEYK